ncbi:MAG: DUF3662 domain-containing protein [Chloroflexota bacterium]|nr:DUF3662 domain-containing protein [Chloroflexota bacterium]
MRWLSRLEDSLEGAFEGTFGRIFRARIQPAEIAKRLERSMEANQSVGVGKMFAPNTYEVALNPRDYEAFERYRLSLERELSTYLQERARATGLTFMTRPQVKLTSEPKVRVGGLRVRSWLQDVEAAEAEHRVEFTQPIEVARTRRRVEPPAASLTVVSGGQHGYRYPLPIGRVSLGRGVDNNIVLEDSRVSRHHAELYVRGSEWYLRDLDSTNGTYVNGYGIRERALESGDRISLGGVELVFHNRR